MSPYRRHLDVSEVQDPCTERWSRMEGTDAVRFCRTCESHVYGLSELRRAEANALLEVVEGRICVRFFRRPTRRRAPAPTRNPSWIDPDAHAPWPPEGGVRHGRRRLRPVVLAARRASASSDPAG